MTNMSCTRSITKIMKEINGESRPLQRQITTTFASCLLCMSAGLSNGLSSVLLPRFAEHENYYSLLQYGWFIAILIPISSILGCLFAGVLLDYLGRKSVHIILAFAFIASWQAMAFGENFHIVLYGRFIARFSFGAARATTVVYLAEISDPKYRGVFLLCPILALDSGILIGHVIATLLSWRAAILVCTIPNILIFIMLLSSKESPYWLISKGNVDDGVQSFRWFRGRGDSAESELRGVLSKQKDKGLLSVREYLKVMTKMRFVRQIMTVFFMFSTVQLCRVNALPLYPRDMLDVILGEGFNTFPFMVFIDSIRVIVCIVFCFFGKIMYRKSMFVSCAFGLCLMLVSLIVVYMKNTSLPIGTESLSLGILFTGIASGLTSLAWSFVAELFPTNARGLGSGLSGAISFILLTLCFQLIHALVWYGKCFMYLGFALPIFVCAVVLYFMLPETNGKKLQDIEENNIIKPLFRFHRV